MDTSLAISIVSVFIAATAVFIAISQNIMQRRHFRLSVKPHLFFKLNRGIIDDKYVFYLAVLNKGLGPAFIDSFSVSFDKKNLGTDNDLQELIKNIDNIIRSFDRNIEFKRRFIVRGSAFSAHTRVNILELSKSIVPDAEIEILTRFVLSFHFVIRYRSIYNEVHEINSVIEVSRRWPIDGSSHGGIANMAEVSESALHALP